MNFVDGLANDDVVDKRLGTANSTALSPWEKEKEIEAFFGGEYDVEE